MMAKSFSVLSSLIHCLILRNTFVLLLYMTQLYPESELENPKHVTVLIRVNELRLVTYFCMSQSQKLLRMVFTFLDV